MVASKKWTQNINEGAFKVLQTLLPDDLQYKHQYQDHQNYFAKL